MKDAPEKYGGRIGGEYEEKCFNCGWEGLRKELEFQYIFKCEIRDEKQYNIYWYRGCPNCKEPVL